jgi:hypothetical protein
MLETAHSRCARPCPQLTASFLGPTQAKRNDTDISLQINEMVRFYSKRNDRPKTIVFCQLPGILAKSFVPEAIAPAGCELPIRFAPAKECGVASGNAKRNDTPMCLIMSEISRFWIERNDTSNHLHFVRDRLQFCQKIRSGCTRPETFPNSRAWVSAFHPARDDRPETTGERQETRESQASSLKPQVPRLKLARREFTTR